MLLIDKIIFFLSSVFFCFLFARVLYSSKWIRLILITAGAGLFTLLTLFVFNEPSENWNIPEQRSIADVEPRPSKIDSSSYKFIWQNFVLIDNSFDKKLIPNEEFSSIDSLSISITDREKLLRLFRMLNEKADMLDLVICDIGFDSKTVYDSLLVKEMLNPAMMPILVLSHNADKQPNEAVLFSKLSQGNITETTSNFLFTSHYLIKDTFFSLPYLIYKKINNIKKVESHFNNRLLIETAQDGNKSWIANPFFPQFTILNETLLLDGPLVFNHPTDSLLEDERSTLYSFTMGSVLSVYGKDIFIDNLIRRKAEGKKNIVFIGSFRSLEEDIHQTVYKKMHGPVILLNIINQLNKRNHLLSVSSVFLIFFLYIIVLWLMLSKSLELPLNHILFLKDGFKRLRKISLIYTGKNIFLQLLSTGLRLFIESIVTLLEFLLVEEPHFTLLFLMAWFFYLFTGTIINITFLISYFGIVYLSLRYAYKKTIKP